MIVSSKMATIKLLPLLCFMIAAQILFNLSFFPYCDPTDETMQKRHDESFASSLHFVPASSTALDYKVPILDKRTAVVVTLSHVDECEAVRIRHLVDTSGLEVWILHGHAVMNKTYPLLVEKSEAIISGISGLKSWPQSTRVIASFDSKISGATKSSFLKFLITHEQYDFAWHVESDVFFTGLWKNVLVTQNTQTDLLVTRMWNKTMDPSWWGRVAKGVNKATCEVDGKACEMIMPFQTYWMLARMSRPLAVALVDDLEKGLVSGHHEAVMASFCAKRGFVAQQLNGKVVGTPFHAGNSVPWDQRKAEKRTNTLARNGPVYANKLYHPIKCVAYSSGSVMQAEIDQWLVSNNQVAP